MKVWDKFALGCILLVSLALRLKPSFGCALWGEDSGEYIYLVKRVIETGSISFDYSGWGIAYPYFPGSYILESAVVQVSSLPMVPVVGMLLPSISSFSSILIYMLVKQIGGGFKPAIISSSFWAVAMPIVYPTSFPIPGSLGGFLLLLSVLLYLKSREEPKFYILLLPSTLALVLTHHLSTYFFFITILFSIFLKNFIAKKPPYHLFSDVCYLTFLLTFTFGYWMFVAIPFRDAIISDAFDIPAIFVLLLAYLVIPILLLVGEFRRRFVWMSSWLYKPKFPDVAKIKLMLSLGIISSILLCILLLVTARIPGTEIPITQLHILFVIPSIAIVFFAFVGISFAEYYKDGFFVYSWLIVYVLSFIVAVITNNRVLIPFRHMQYIMEPLCIFSGLGLTLIYKFLIPHKTTSGEIRNMLPRKFISSFVFVLLIMSACFSIPPQELNGGFVDGTSDTELTAAYWVEHSLNDTATFVSDHRMCSILFGFSGVNQTGDQGKDLLLSSKFEKEKWTNHTTPAGRRVVDHVLIDDAVSSGISGPPWEDAPKMNDSAKRKFESEPFVKIFQANDVTIYRVDYSFV